MFRTLVASIIAGLLTLAAWYWLGRPVPIAEPPIHEPLSCLSYAPFRDDESPFDADVDAKLNRARITSDLRLLAGYTSCIRVYASAGMEQIPALAETLGMKVLMGAWVSGDKRATRQEIDTLVKLANAYPNTIPAVLVGNEALLRKEIEPDELARLIADVKQRVTQPVSYADVWEFQLSNPQVAEASDFVTIHILPYWEDEPVAIDNAIGHVRAIRRRVADRFPGKKILIGEAGWPSVGRMREGALPSPANESRFIRGFVATARAEGWDYNLIEAFDQPWKRRLEGAVGGYWGVFDTSRHDKHLLSGSVTNHPYWLTFALISTAIGTLIIIMWRLSAIFAPLAAACSIGWTMQMEQLWMITRNGLELGGAIALLGMLLMACVAPMARLAGKPFRDRFEAGIALLAGSTAAVLSLWLVFDPRYRDFFVAGFMPLGLLMVMRSRTPNPVMRQGHEELAIAMLLFASAVAITIIETVQNYQALVWSLSCGLLGGGLVSRALRNPYRSAESSPPGERRPA